MLLDRETAQFLSSAAQTRRYQAASLIAAQGLVESAKFYDKASQELATPAAMQVRYLNMLSELGQRPSEKLMMMEMHKFS